MLRSVFAVLLFAVLAVPARVDAQYPFSNNNDGNRSGRVYLGSLSANPYGSDSISNPYGRFGSPYSNDSVRNPFGPYGSPYSARSATNPFTMDAPRIYGRDGTYLGRLSPNPYDSDSVSNPYGRFGSPYSSLSINNPYGQCGSPFAAQSASNPYTSSPPSIFGRRY